MLCFGAVAQSKIGYVNTQTVLDSMPEKKLADTKVACYIDSFSVIFRTLMDSYLNAPCGKFGAPRTDPSSPMAIMDSLGKLEDKIPALISEYSDSLYDLLRTDITKAIDAVAKEHGYNYVLDSSVDAIYALNEGDNDLTPLVIQKLRMK